MSISDQKRAARTAAFTHRRAAQQANADADARAAGHVVRLATDLARPLVVSGYVPIGTELDPQPAMTALLAAGHQVCVPVVVGPATPLKFRTWSPDVELVKAVFGTLVPKTGEWVEPDFLIAPLLAFDDAGYRLGYGGGFYDRTLEILRAKRPTKAVGFAYSEQKIRQVPIDQYDQRLDHIVTENGRIDFP